MSLGDWLKAEGLPPAGWARAIADVNAVRSLLFAAAAARRPMSYSELLGALGHRFTRPKMRALCRTLDAIDGERRIAGRAGLAVLVVRESDGLPGQGWWAGTADRRRYAGSWTGPDAAALVTTLQARAYDDVASERA